MNMNINWYPGHMKKTRESIKENLSIVDLVLELIDARIPYSSQNPIIDTLIKNKPRIIVLNKSDLADDNANRLWQEYFKRKSIDTLLLDSLGGKGINNLLRMADKTVEEKSISYRNRGVISRPTRAMIIGIPNVGKSTLINTLSGRKGAKTGNKPGITKSNQWIKTKGKLELLDTPGILWPKFEEEIVGLNLAFTGAIKDEILDIESLAFKFIERMIKLYPKSLDNRYDISIDGLNPLEIMEAIGRRRGCLIKGGDIDYRKVSNIILDEFRKGLIGNITLELPIE